MKMLSRFGLISYSLSVAVRVDEAVRVVYVVRPTYYAFPLSGIQYHQRRKRGKNYCSYTIISPGALAEASLTFDWSLE